MSPCATLEMICGGIHKTLKMGLVDFKGRRPVLACLAGRGKHSSSARRRPQQNYRPRIACLPLFVSFSLE